jgi:hypothetical protein
MIPDTSLSQGDADIPTVYSVPDSFKVIATEYGPNFHCTTCNVEVEPWAASVGGLVVLPSHFRCNKPSSFVLACFDP